MDDDSAAADGVVGAIEDGATEAARSGLDALADAPPDVRSDAVRELRQVADDRPARFDGLASALAPLLADEERSVRLTTAKLFVALADAEPAVVVPAVDPLADRLADDGEFYYVRARSAEALGLVALDSPDEVGSPEILADLRIGLKFEEPAVKEKLAKAIECVALGDPDRLSHQVGRLAEHLGDDGELVRYHLCTALVVVGAFHPGKLAEAVDPLGDRLGDADPHVRARAAEALGQLARSDATASLPRSALDDLAAEADGDSEDEAAAFVAERVAFARAGAADDATEGVTEPGSVGSLDSIRASTERAVETMTTPDADGECPHCGLELPEQGPPMCPRCGAPR
ncbi:HEAT repeat domain-containing protein [Halosimplex litoreum]|uniref:HEAT repeat domain-containing protein n=1 Tax=Halosimplex litoreum TaxID=1198301 RepID=A0A7T3G054_9EURY|nr:HEAT repeat domain-containing protein [Halosimplex litoreum]QPV63836.1 HEAT repeat domain-containing protein [Halosimplex litoreum]